MPSTRRVVLAVALVAGTAVLAVRACTPPAPDVVPGAPPPAVDAELAARLRAAVVAKGPSYVARTRHKGKDGAPAYTNRLILETSPYLLQHAHNPVDWFPWGDEAFARARALGRPVFLSVGYSTCHWCHVMEEESFEDEAIARFLNEHYVCIKVDREERPDVDATYMAFVQSLTGSGGWPMSVWLTPDREPFFGGTYFPPRASGPGKRPGFLEVMTEHASRFRSDPAAVVAEARRMGERLHATTAPAAAGELPGVPLLTLARAEAVARFDATNGGMRGAPKFPSSFPNRLLLRIARRTNDAAARLMVTTTLDRMASGGLHDALGGGFHRYSTDARWLVPHFEKMLYDNALLAIDYLEGFQATGDASHEATTRDTLDYVLQSLRADDGTFYSATDADSLDARGRREEGAYFTWRPDEVRRALDADGARAAIEWYGITEAGQVDGRSVLHTPRSRADVARALAIDEATLGTRIAAARTRLFDARETRPRPLRDDKVIVSWNGIAISALARAAIVLGDGRYGEAAIRAATTLIATTTDGRALPHVLAGGKAQGLAFADDHAALAAALLDVFELTADPAWLTRAIALMDELERGFADAANGGYYGTSAGHEVLLVREKSTHDGPTPTASALAAMTWSRLFEITGDDRYRQRAETTLRAFSTAVSAHPLSMHQLLLSLDWETDAAKEIVVVVPEGAGALAPEARPLLDVLRRTFVPNSVLVVATEKALAGEVGRAVPWAQDKTLRGGRPTAYVCEHRTCKQPTTEPTELARQLAEARPYR
jgi:hypothetical protein